MAKIIVENEEKADASSFHYIESETFGKQIKIKYKNVSMISIGWKSYFYTNYRILISFNFTYLFIPILIIV